jgi:hypothetical protein
LLSVRGVHARQRLTSRQLEDTPKIAAIAFLIPSPIWGAAPSFITTVQVIPALINTSGGTCDT